MKLLGIQVGLPRTHGHSDAPDPMDRAWTSGFYKDPVNGPVAVGYTSMAGDGQADLRVHGGPDKAINAYPTEHYTYWRTELKLDFIGGAFGENFTTGGRLETDVWIGDIFRIGALLVQISQPRQPCWKLARRWRVPDLAARVEKNGRTGWYFRVLETATIQSPYEMTLVKRPHPAWTVAEANAIMHHRKTDREAALALAGCAALSCSWQTSLTLRVNATSQAS